MLASIKAIEYYLPKNILTNEHLAKTFSGWTAEKIENKTGIKERHIASDLECASDLAYQAANKLFASGICDTSQIDFLLFCTQSPDYFLPTTACLLQEKLKLSNSIGALDFNLGCSGYIYGLSIAKGLIESLQARNILLITAETYSKYMHPKDSSTRTIFGDGAAATLVTAIDDDSTDEGFIGHFLFGTDGKGAKNLILENGAIRSKTKIKTNNDGDYLYMDGPEIFAFTFRAVPKLVRELLVLINKNLEEIDLFIFHQANKYMLEHLCNKLEIPEEKFYVSMKHCGNTVSSSIPIALKDAQNEGVLHGMQQVMLVGFGVGYSWGATIVKVFGMQR